MSNFINNLRALGTSLPIYTTRPHGGDKETASYSQSLWMTLFVQLFATTNALLWGVYGIVQAVEHLANL